MLDINLLRKDLDAVVERLKTRKTPQPFLNVAAYQSLELERKVSQQRTEALQAERNRLSREIGELMRQGKTEQAQAVRAEVAQHKVELEQSAARLDQLQGELLALLQAVPNLPHESVPVGADESGNVELRRWSPQGGFGANPPELGFEAQDHVALAEPLGLDFETAAKLSGSRFAVMKGPVARLHRALAQFMLDLQTQQHGYTECYVPYKRLLPRLSRSVRRTLAQVHPEFMTPERLSVFQAQLPLLGLWPRAGHGEALSHLRTEFRAHLAQEREKAGESKLLDELAGQKSQVTQALQWVQAELQRREAQAPLPSDAQGLGTRGHLPAYLDQRKGPFA